MKAPASSPRGLHDRRPRTSPVRRRVRTRTWALSLLLGAVLAVGLAGPWLAPHSATELVTTPYAAPAPAYPLGTDHLGRDVLSRLLLGAPPVVLTTVAATAVTVALGTLAGLSAALVAHRRPAAEGVVMRPFDALAALPPMLALLLVLTAVPSRAGVVLAACVAGAPLSARVIRAAALPVLRRPHVELSLARGEPWSWVLRHEVLPLVATTVLADAGLRFVFSLYLVSAAGFLGVGVSGFDWGTLVHEALPGAALQPWALLAPLTLIAFLAVGVNLLSDNVFRTEAEE
ncbi:ABC transporter permease subunit [Streptomyces tubbatahanensis]|uniref:ABC transporter permease subunit n=1 Tax=Streptomyces tubbatahanensis TaxID=2923272 RepID=A0ABY3XNW6_9ACTN|nr:ABC transporter permease subunit [Streptomyces tubbatahanensis]UNS95888.1 ABC transporter permease subunit [Streptomyces tubbatahanensis]